MTSDTQITLTAPSIWLHRPETPIKQRPQQSGIARQLIQSALSSLHLALPTGLLEQSGLSIASHIHQTSGLYLSISHCPLMVAIALGGEPLGIDCESTLRQRPWQAMADQFFSPQEARLLSALPAQAKGAQFARLWTLKEAYIKARGGNLFTDLNTISENSGKTRHAAWQVWRLEEDPVYITLCVLQQQLKNPIIASSNHDHKTFTHSGHAVLLGS